MSVDCPHCLAHAPQPLLAVEAARELGLPEDTPHWGYHVLADETVVPCLAPALAPIYARLQGKPHRRHNVRQG